MQNQKRMEISTDISTAMPLAIAIFRVSDSKIIQINTLFRINKKRFMKWIVENFFCMKLNYEVLAHSYSNKSFWEECSVSPRRIRTT